MNDFLSKFESVLRIEENSPSDRQECQLQRAGVFVNPQNNFLGQFNHIYSDRLEKLKRRFPHNQHLIKISMVQENQTSICGLLHKRYKKKKQNVEKNIDMPNNTNEMLFSPQDEAELADQSGSIRIVLNEATIIDKGDFAQQMNIESTLSIQDLPHGVAIQVEGQLNENINSFVCSLVRFPQLPLQPHTIKDMFRSASIDFQQMESKLQKDDNLIMFVSGLEMTHFDHLNNFLNARYARLTTLSKVTSLIICGGLPNNKLQHRSLKQLDAHLEKLSQIITIFYMPSTQDFQDHLWPAKPASKYLIPRSADKIHRCSNPDIFNIGKVTLLGTCGENISEMKRVCTLSDDMDIMEAHLMFNHLAPSAPSSLFTAPSPTDPLILSHLPNVYFSSGMNKFSSKVLSLGRQSCKLLLIPNFSNGIVLLNSRTADCCLIELY